MYIGVCVRGLDWYWAKDEIFLTYSKGLCGKTGSMTIRKDPWNSLTVKTSDSFTSSWTIIVELALLDPNLREKL